MVGRSPKSEKLDKRRGPSDHGDPARACRFKAASAPAGRETTRVIRAVQGEAGDKDRTELPVLAGSLTQPDHVAPKEGHERCPPYMSRRVDKVNLSLLNFFTTRRDFRKYSHGKKR